MGRKAFSIHSDYYEELCNLSEVDRGKVLMALVNWSTDGPEVELPMDAAILFRLIKAQNQRFSEQQAERGKKGGRPSKAEKAEKAMPLSEKPEKASETNSITITDTITDKNNYPPNPPAVADGEAPVGVGKVNFTPPTVDEVAVYCQERNNGIDAEHFIDFYAAKGWLIGKNKMKDWQAAVRTWEKNHKNSVGNRGQPYPEDGKPHPDGGVWYNGKQLMGV